jgi:hypothetical protein
MASRGPTSNPRQHARHEPLYDIDPRTGASIEVFYMDRTLETFGRCGAGWFWWPRRRGCSPDGLATGPFATSYAAYRHAMTTSAPITLAVPKAGHRLDTECRPNRLNT